MTAKNKILSLLLLSGAAAAATAAINKAIQLSAVSRHLLEEDQDSLCYHWRLGDIHYTKQGSGKPLLLIHDLEPASSSFEWKETAKRLSKDHTVYSIDLLGFGRSEKPDLIYTNYLYVQLLSDFIKSEIGHRTDVAVSGASSSLAVMACSNYPELFDRLLLVNPETLLSSSLVPGKNAKLYKFILDLPIVGTLIYHISCSERSITRDFMSQYFYNPYSVSRKLIQVYHESAHLGDSPKSVFASIECHYTKCNISNALKKINNSIYIIGSSSLDFMEETLDEYKFYNPAIELIRMDHAKKLPHLECPSRFCSLFQTYLA